jgi:hypothetical protein
VRHSKLRTSLFEHPRRTETRSFENLFNKLSCDCEVDDKLVSVNLILIYGKDWLLDPRLKSYVG